MSLAFLPLLTTSLGLLQGGVWGIVGIVFGLLFYGAIALQDRRFPTLPLPILIGVGVGFAGVMLLNLVSPYPSIAWGETLRLASFILPLMLLAAPALQTAFSQSDRVRWWGYVTIAGCILLGTELATGGILLPHLWGADANLNKYNRGLSYAAILIWPLLSYLALRRQWWMVALLSCSFFYPLLQTESRATLLAVAVGMGVLGLAYYLPRLTRWLLGGLTLASIGWPFYAAAIMAAQPAWLPKLPASWQARVEIWDYFSYHIMARPLLGWGLGSSGQLPVNAPHAGSYLITTMPAAHPHNLMTQLWVELGLFGVILGLVVALATLVASRKLPLGLQPFALAAWATGFVLTLCAYNIWTDSLWAALVLTLFVFASLKQQLPRPTN